MDVLKSKKYRGVSEMIKDLFKKAMTILVLFIIGCSSKRCAFDVYRKGYLIFEAVSAYGTVGLSRGITR
ncbi:MAG: hypothetical protein J5I47_12400 [Vicingus serpentipes]|nr:hypothetical protein [Vicingus serpentipes]